MNDELDTPAPDDGGGDQSAPLTLEKVYQTHKIEDDAAKYQRNATEYRPVQPVHAPVQEDSGQATTSGFLNQLVDSHNSLATKINAAEAKSMRESIDKDIESAVSAVNTGLNLKPAVVKAHLNAKADEDPRFKRVWEMRHSNPQAWNDVLKAVQQEMADDFQVRPDPDLLANQRAMRAFQSGSASKRANDSPGANLGTRDFERFWNSI